MTRICVDNKLDSIIKLQNDCGLSQRMGKANDMRLILHRNVDHEWDNARAYVHLACFIREMWFVDGSCK